ncbi:glycosyltransferase family 4 protein [Candidatus Marinimicrobia bacterium]|nr:glycosyltransferase family 4 protein [Candidatus Neomarinimicrobiota bacterium]
MHICFVEIGYPRPTTGVVGGAGTYVKLIATQLVQKGYKISVICGRVKNNSTYYNDGDINVYPVIEYGPLHYFISKIPILNIFSKLVRYLETGFKIYRMLCIINYKNKIDLVEYSEGGDFWNRYTKKFKYISHLHGSAYTFKNNSGQNVDLSDWLHRIAEHYFIKNSKEVISPSNAMVELVESEIGKVFQNVNVIPYPIDEYQIVKSQNTPPPEKNIRSIFSLLPGMTQ